MTEPKNILTGSPVRVRASAFISGGSSWVGKVQFVDVLGHGRTYLVGNDDGKSGWFYRYELIAIPDNHRNGG